MHKYLDNKEVDANNIDETFVRKARQSMQETIDNIESTENNITEEERVQNQFDDITEQYVDLVKKLKLEKVELIKAENPTTRGK